MARPEDIAADVVLAEAAAWIVRLQAGERTPDLDSAFEDWMAHPAHARAYERATKAWEIIPPAGRPRPTKPARAAQSSWSARRSVWPVFAGGVLAALIVCALVLLNGWSAVYETQPGQLQCVTLRDGTRVTLNTASEITVAYTLWSRQVRLIHGEAMFEVARSARRPFLVRAGDEQIRDLGTVFTVRRDGPDLTVVLVKGKVQVARRAPRASQLVQVATLSPGERLRILAKGDATVDRPSIDIQLAWLRGQVIFDDSPLIEAVREINRYGGPRLELADPSLDSLRVSGLFQTHEPTEFAAVVAELDHLRIEHRNGAVILSR